MTDHESREVDETTSDTPVVFSHLIHTIVSYRTIILVALASVFLVYSVGALAYYLFAPAERVTTVPFRLDFDGAVRGEYPNGLHFDPSQIVAGTVLSAVYRADGLRDYVTFEKFADSMVVLESNTAYELLTREVQARLSDPRLTPVDRDRIDRDFQSKRASLAKNQFSLNYIVKKSASPLPKVVIDKVMTHIFSEWIRYATTEQRVLQFQIPILSTSFVDAGTGGDDDLLSSLRLLRNKITRIDSYMGSISRLPGEPLAHARSTGATLLELQARLDEILRFRIEPLIASLASSPIANRVGALQAMESQLGHDERLLEQQRGLAESIRQSLAAYQTGGGVSASSAASADSKGAQPVVPQINDTFIDKLVMLANQPADATYRQRLVTDYRDAQEHSVPLEVDVAYDREILQRLRAAPVATGLELETVRKSVATAQQDLRSLVSQTNEINAEVSKTLIPDTPLVTVTAVPLTYVDRAISLGRLGLFGVLALLLSLPVIVIGCLLHNRVREEDELDEALAHPGTVDSPS